MENSYTVFMSERSPFARRTRLLLEELKIPYQVKIENVFSPSAELYEVNPLGRVPVLILPNGERLIDSYQIEEYFRARNLTHWLFESHGFSEAQARNYIGLSVGIMEHTVSIVLERFRASVWQSPVHVEEMLEAIDRTLTRLENEMRGLYLLGEQPGIWDITLGAALAYCDLRLGRSVVDKFPSLRRSFEALNQRESFQKTIPPQA